LYKIVEVVFGESKKINFEVQKDKSFLQFVEFSSEKNSYTIPVYMISNSSIENTFESSKLSNIFCSKSLSVSSIIKPLDEELSLVTIATLPLNSKV
jgi:hypothetical protein